MLNTAWRDTGALLEQLKANWRPFLAIHVAVSVLVFVLLAPLSALLLRFLVSLSGDAALSDQDILYHILSPAGFLAFMVMVSVVSIIVFLEYAALITAAWMTEKGAEVSVLGVLAFLAGRSGRLFGLALSLLLRVLLYTAPFLVLLGGIYWALLSEFDINFYLSTRPTEWYTALGLAGLVVLGWCAMILYLLSGWIFALPLLLLGLLVVLLGGLVLKEGLSWSKGLAVGLGFAVSYREEDGVAKTPAWAAEITGVPADTIQRIARLYAQTKPAALMDCQGPARSAMGEQYNRCAATLCAMTGNVGRPGGSAGGGLMGCAEGRSSDEWIDFDFYGHQIVAHTGGDAGDQQRQDGGQLQLPGEPLADQRQQADHRQVETGMLHGRSLSRQGWGKGRAD